MATTAQALAEFRQCYTSLLLAADVLRTAIEREAGVGGAMPPEMRAIQIVVATHYRLAPVDLLSQRRTNEIAHPRMVALALCRELTDFTQIAIGNAFGRDHGTVIHAQRAVADWCACDPKFAARYKTLRAAAAAAVAEAKAHA